MRFQITKQPSEPAIIEIPIAAKTALRIKSSIILKKCSNKILQVFFLSVRRIIKNAIEHSSAI